MLQVITPATALIGKATIGIKIKKGILAMTNKLTMTRQELIKKYDELTTVIADYLWREDTRHHQQHQWMMMSGVPDTEFISPF